MGFIPHIRYILLSDLLLERMPDDEIEAVFAHEVGHIVHRHMNWYVIFVLVLGLINAGPGTRLGDAIASRLGGHAQDLFPASLMLGTFLLLFGYISRKFEHRRTSTPPARCKRLTHCNPPCSRFSDLLSPPLVLRGRVRVVARSRKNRPARFQRSGQSRPHPTPPPEYRKREKTPRPLPSSAHTAPPSSHPLFVASRSSTTYPLPLEAGVTAPSPRACNTCKASAAIPNSRPASITSCAGCTCPSSQRWCSRPRRLRSRSSCGPHVVARQERTKIGINEKGQTRS